MKSSSALLVLGLSAWIGLAIEAAAGGIVGTVTIEMADRSTARTITSELWFEAGGARRDQLL